MSEDTVILTKLQPPKVTGVVERPRLLRLFGDREQVKLFQIIAPAGYGKTVLMLQAAKKVKTPVVWYQLDRYDNDLATFLQYLVTGIRKQLPTYDREALQLLEQGDISQRRNRLLTLIVNGLLEQDEDDLLIALDDYHLITGKNVHEFVTELIFNLPPGVQIVIASRVYTPLRVKKLFGTGEALVIGAKDLQFTQPEITALTAEMRN